MNSPIDNAALEQLNDKDKAELRQFLTNEQNKARIQDTVHSLTDMCWKKCVTSSIRGSKLDKYEEDCMTNCAARFIEASSLTMRHLQQMRNVRDVS